MGPLRTIECASKILCISEQTSYQPSTLCLYKSPYIEVWAGRGFEQSRYVGTPQSQDQKQGAEKITRYLNETIRVPRACCVCQLTVSWITNASPLCARQSPLQYSQSHVRRQLVERDSNSSNTMRMTSKVILYDLPSKGRCACWSLNPWKSIAVFASMQESILMLLVARLALNFKGVPYETKWLEYPDVAPTFKDT